MQKPIPPNQSFKPSQAEPGMNRDGHGRIKLQYKSTGAGDFDSNYHSSSTPGRISPIGYFFRFLICPIVFPFLCLYYVLSNWEALVEPMEEAYDSEDEDEAFKLEVNERPSHFRKFCEEKFPVYIVACCFGEEVSELQKKTALFLSKTNKAAARRKAMGRKKRDSEKHKLKQYSLAIDLARTDRMVLPYEGEWIDGCYVAILDENGHYIYPEFSDNDDDEDEALTQKQLEEAKSAEDIDNLVFKMAVRKHQRIAKEAGKYVPPKKDAARRVAFIMKPNANGESGTGGDVGDISNASNPSAVSDEGAGITDASATTSTSTPQPTKKKKKAPSEDSYTGPSTLSELYAGLPDDKVLRLNSSNIKDVKGPSLDSIASPSFSTIKLYIDQQQQQQQQQKQQQQQQSPLLVNRSVSPPPPTSTIITSSRESLRVKLRAAKDALGE